MAKTTQDQTLAVIRLKKSALVFPSFVPFGREARFAWRYAQFFKAMCKEAYLTLTLRSIIAYLRAIPTQQHIPCSLLKNGIQFGAPCRMHPILKHIVSIWTTVASWAMTILHNPHPKQHSAHDLPSALAYILHVNTRDGRIFELFRISATGLFSIVCQWARRPIMGFESWTLVDLPPEPSQTAFQCNPHLKVLHSELICHVLGSI